jgi:hypothetical protein
MPNFSRIASHLLLAASVAQIGRLCLTLPVALLLFAWALGLIHLIH